MLKFLHYVSIAGQTEANNAACIHTKATNGAICITTWVTCMLGKHKILLNFICIFVLCFFKTFSTQVFFLITSEEMVKLGKDVWNMSIFKRDNQDQFFVMISNSKQ